MGCGSQAERVQKCTLLTQFMMTVIFRKNVIKIGTSKAITIPSKWAENKKEIGAVLFDMNNKEERRLFFETQEYIIEKQE